MKEIGGSGGGKRSESEREKTKMRERQRRAITSNMLHGLRKHGSYRLSPRADINEVLRELAKEAGWIVEPDGTTYRSNSKVLNGCPLCGGGGANANANANCKISSEGGKWSTLPVGGGDYNNNSSLLCFDKQPISVTECSASANAMLMVDPPAVMTTYEEEEEEGEALLHSEGEAANIMSNHLINTALLGPLPLLLPLPLPHF